MSESEIVRAVLEWLHLKGIMAWRCNQSPIPLPNGGFRRFVGLKGVSDILGILPQTVILQAVREPVQFGNFLAVECKTEKGRLRPEQRDFLAAINARGGIAVVVHSVEELERELRDYL